MPKVIIQNNSIEGGDEVSYETNDVLATLFEHFDGALPDNTRIYAGQVAEVNDITPGQIDIEKDIERLAEIQGTIYVVNYPQFFLFGLTGILGTLLKVLLLGLLSYLFRPKPPKERNKGEQSPNNGLSERVNSARLKERIPDIYGSIRATPDLIAKPYFRFENHREVEYMYLCVGRGEFEITDIKDDITPIGDISGVTYGIYGPGTSPNSGSAQTTYGTLINERVWAAAKSNAVNGQALRAPNASKIKGELDIAFNSPDTVSTNNSEVDFEQYFVPGDNLTIELSVSGDNGLDLDGLYEVLSVSNNFIVLVNPGLVNANWDTGPFNTGYSSAKLSTTSDKWVGPFVIEGPYRILCNFIASNGLYTDDGEDQFSMSVEIETESTLLDSEGEPTATKITNTVNIQGSAALTNARMNSAYFVLPGQTIEESKTNKWHVRCRRVTESPEYDDRRVVDEIQWQGLYAMGYVEQDDFGNVTTIQVRTPATQGALSIKQRKFNCLTTRLLDNSNFNGPYGTVTNNSGSLIIYNIARDVYLGNMEESELDIDSIFGSIKENELYFGTDASSSFGYTFDDKQMSSEEMIQIVSSAVFCDPYRQGSLLKLNFERTSELSSLQFNHRNKIPKSETRSIQFGTPDNTDGVEFDWVDSSDGAVETFQIPATGSAINPKKIELVGIGSRLQAHFHAWREWQKIQFQNFAVSFDATAEAATLTTNERILIADNTRQETVDGDVLSQSGTLLGLSQPFEKKPGVDYTIHLQHSDGQIESLPVLAAPSDRTITVGDFPRLELSTSPDNFARATYIITNDGDVQPLAFLVKEIDPQSSQVVSVSAVNYDERYYSKDKDFINGIVNEKGNIL